MNKTLCSTKQCEYDCRMTGDGPTCFCPLGQQADNNKCVDADECTVDESCDQICVNTIGSFECSCVSGYLKENNICKAINVPDTEEPSVIFSTQRDIRRITLNGSAWEGNSTLKLLNTHALEFSHRNRTFCYIHNNFTLSSFVCVNIDNWSERWVMPSPHIFSSMESIHQLALDWISGNWYFVDDTREIIFLCNSTMTACTIVLELELSKPRGLALDPTKGFMFFTKWGHSAPMLERALLDGSERKPLVDHKIVYPYGVTVDFATQKVYWVDTYLDYVERVSYDGSNRKSVKKGIVVQNLYSVSVFQTDLFVSSWHNDNVIRLSRKHNNEKEQHLVKNITRPFNIHVFHRQRQPDAAHPCRENNGGCEHICVPAWKRSIAISHCLCQPGFRLKNNKRCISASQPTFLIYGKRRAPMIRGISLSPGRRDRALDVMIPITNVSPGSFDYDVHTQFVYYSDLIRYVIERQSLDGKKRELVIDTDVNSCEGLAIDWMGRNIYWTDEGLARIYVASLKNTTQRRILVHGIKFHPRSIALDPANGRMYWTDWATGTTIPGKIETAWMDGTHRDVFVNNDTLWPNGLTIDYVGKKLYWCDAYLDKIEMIGLDGQGRKVIYFDKKLDHPSSLAYYNNTLYWTEGVKGYIFALKLDENGTKIDTLSTENPPLVDIKVYDNKAQGGENDCSSNNMNCPELCLSTPNGGTCACTEGYDYQTSNKSCTKLVNYKPPMRCAENYFQCAKTKGCVSKKYVCDGFDDCGDGSDESTAKDGPCEYIKCNENEFKCDNNRCISKLWVCDGDNDCLEGSDESPLRCQTSCPSHQFTCNITGRCIPKAWTCDGEPDCGQNDTSDEHEKCANHPTCLPFEFKCANNHCIPRELFCNGEDNCMDNSDEEQCTDLCDTTTQFMCKSDVICISISRMCDGVKDCSDGSDETNCRTSETKPTKSSKNKTKETSICEKHEFKCSNNECIMKKFQCDGHIDCVDGSDEVNCESLKILNVTSSPPTTLECDHPNRLCDNNTKCLSVEYLCDGKPDCADGKDEGFRCEEHLCDHSFDCSHICHNAPEGMVCSCPGHLHLQSDKMTCLEAHPCAVWGTCSQKCIPKNNRHACNCFDGYYLEKDGFTCKSTDPATPYVIFSNRHEIRGVDLNTFSVKTFISSLKNTIALDFYYKDKTNMVFWTDVIDDKIYRGTLIGGSLSKIEVVVSSGLSTAEGLAVDWVAENLYWVESNLDQIEVARLNGSYRRTLIAGEMESPRAIALDPRDGLLFWTDWDANNPRIERCSMAGRNRNVVVRVDQLTDGAWPNGLTLDYDLRRIYWIDARSDSIHTTTYEGADHQLVIKGHEMLSHPFAIALYGSYVYWTDWRTNSVIRANKWTGAQISVIQRTLTQPFDIQILHPSRQPRVPNPCSKNNGGCSHLCLLNGNGTYECDCPHVMRLEADRKTCRVNERVLLFSRENEIRGLDLEQPYYHTIPTISHPQVLAPSQLEFVAATNRLYWTDVQVNEVKRTGLTQGPTQTLIDTGIEHSTGLAIDWISKVMFFSSFGATYKHISACNLDGEYITVIISGVDVTHVTSLAVDITKGVLYWTNTIAKEDGNASHHIMSAATDGSNRRVLYTQETIQDNVGPRSLFVDLDSLNLYWVDTEESNVQYYDFTKSK